jgi:hypothetical protein
MPDSRFRSDVATTQKLAASRTAGSIFLPHRRFQIYTRDIGDRCQPGQNVRKLERQFFVSSLAKCRGQLADLFHQPHERPFNPTRRVLGTVHLSNESLQIAQTQRRRLGHVQCLVNGEEDEKLQSISEFSALRSICTGNVSRFHAAVRFRDVTSTFSPDSHPHHRRVRT